MFPPVHLRWWCIIIIVLLARRLGDTAVEADSDDDEEAEEYNLESETAEDSGFAFGGGVGRGVAGLGACAWVTVSVLRVFYL